MAGLGGLAFAGAAFVALAFAGLPAALGALVFAFALGFAVPVVRRFFVTDTSAMLSLCFRRDVSRGN
jgi:hypothetical protein